MEVCKVGVDLIKHLTKRQLVELDACVHCGECVGWCPVVDTSNNYQNTPMDKITDYRSFVQVAHGLRAKIFGPSIDREKLKQFADDVYKCTTCGRCGVVCPVGINCQELWPDIRATLLEMGFGPKERIDSLREVLERKHNPFDLPREDRNKWLKELEINPEPRAKFAFFTGCELAYRTKGMAIGAVKALTAANEEFTIFEDEYCCGFPLYVLGDRSEEVKSEILHNVEGLKAMGAEVVAPYCPCCFAVMKHIWKNYVEIPFKVVHILEVVADLVESGRLKFTKPFSGKVTYHDPCYLSRGWGDGAGVIEQPRRIINAIPGIELVEMEHNRLHSRCPGSGGGLRRSNPELSEEMAGYFIVKEAEATGAKVLLTACPAVNERLNYVKSKNKTKLEIVDVLDFAANQI